MPVADRLGEDGHVGLDAVAQVGPAQGKPPLLVGPIGSDEGVYLVQILARKESEALPFSQVKDKVRQQVLMQRMQVRTAKWLEQLRKKTYIDIRL